jgi:DtxR family Mn-dependent transcriptional regulator
LNFTESEENYIKAIFHLQLDSHMVSTSALAERLQSRPASITDMMKKLSAKRLLHYKPYHGFNLTTEGRKVALSVIRRHRLWEFFLSDKLGFGWDEIHTVAEQLEHVSSKKLIDKLDEYLDFPKFDPHGDPIPDKRGRIKTSNNLSLNHLPLHQPALVSRVSQQSAQMLELMQHQKISIGSIIEIKKYFEFDRSMQIKLKGNKTETISEQLAKNIFVTYEK